MSTLSAVPPTVGGPDPRVERSLVAAALAAALLLHVAVFLLPLRFGREVPERAAPHHGTVIVHPFPLPPPPLPDRPVAPPRGTRRTPVPFPAPDVEPVFEPVADPDPPEMPDGIIDPLLVPPVAPPRPVGPVDEQTAGLMLPQPLTRPAPEYPPIAIRAGRSGRVVLRAVIDTDGAVGEIQVVQAPRPDLGLVAAALEAVSRWTFEPGRLDGRPVAVSMTVIVDFAIE